MVLPKQNKKTKLILVSGPAGAGRTTAIRSLEDLGFEAIDNLPLDLVQSVLKPEKTSENIAIGLDTRGRDFSVEGLLGLLKVLSNLEHVDFELLYLSCTMEVLLRRYSETRRRHPLANGNSPHEGIEKELMLLEPIRNKADILIFLTRCNVTENGVLSHIKKVSDDSDTNVGVILNGVGATNSYGYSYGYRYGYGYNYKYSYNYGYGYGYNEESS